MPGSATRRRRASWVTSDAEEECKLPIRRLRAAGSEAYLRRTFLGAKQFSIEGLEDRKSAG